MATMVCAYAQVCTEETLDWAHQLRTFGAALAERQGIRHKLVDLLARACKAKVVATQAMQFCADQAVQILGGAGYMRGTRSERLYREVKVMMIGAGSEEIMKDLAARKLAL